MRNMARTSVHGRHDAEREWRRIIDFAARVGLVAVPAARPEFGAGETRTARRSPPPTTTAQPA